MTLEARRAGDAIARSAGHLARTWRASRMQARSSYFPGLLDGVLEDFLERAGEALAAGRDPALVWPATSGLVRLDPRDLARALATIDAEWDLAAEVLDAACEALDAGEAAAEWFARAIVIARAGSRTLHHGGGPAEIALAWLLSPIRPPARTASRP